VAALPPRARRHMTEIRRIIRSVAPDAIEAMHPAFDVTPSRYVTAIVCERGVARAPYEESLRKLAEAC